MATEIKAIQCPKCGSTEKTELPNEHYRCDSCGTEYFLDDGNARIGPKPGIVDPRRQAQPTAKGCSPLAIFLSILLIGVLAICFIYISSSSSTQSYSSTSSSATMPTKWQYVNAHVYLSADGRPIIVGAGYLSRYTNNGYSMEPFVFFVDAITAAMLKKLPIPGEKTQADTYQFHQLSNGDLYLIADRTVLFQVDKRSFDLKDVSQTFGSQERQLQSGIAQIEFVSSGYEDGFKLMTNDGKNLYYYPLVHKIYRDKELWDAQKGMKTLLPSAVEKTGYTFSNKSDSREEDTIQLVKYRFMDNVGGPKELPWFRWDDRSSPPLFVYPKDDYRCLSYSNFTPGRIYYEPKVLYSDSDYVLISYATSAAGTIRYVQCLNARTAAIVFTTRLDDRYLEEGTVRFKGGFVCTYLGVHVISMDGKLKNIKTDNE